MFKVKNKDVAATLFDVIAMPSLLTLDIFSFHCFFLSNLEHIFACSKIFHLLCSNANKTLYQNESEAVITRCKDYSKRSFRSGKRQKR